MPESSQLARAKCERLGPATNAWVVASLRLHARACPQICSVRMGADVDETVKGLERLDKRWDKMSPRLRRVLLLIGAIGVLYTVVDLALKVKVLFTGDTKREGVTVNGQGVVGDPAIGFQNNNILQTGPKRRHVLVTARNELVSELLKLSPERLRIGSIMGDPDAREIAAILLDALKSAHWSGPDAVDAIVTTDAAWGVVMSTKGTPDAAAAYLLDWCVRAGLQPHSVTNLNKNSTDDVSIYVGPAP